MVQNRAQEIVEKTAESIDDTTANLIIDRIADEFAFSANVGPQYEEPNKFRKACDHDDLLQRDKWRKRIHNEFRNMNK
jgi:hypothetical protein